MSPELNERQPDITLGEIFRLPEIDNIFDEDDIREYKRLGDKFRRSKFRRVQAMSAHFNLQELQNLERIWDASDGEPYLYYDMLFQIMPVDVERLDESIENSYTIFNEDSTESLVNSYRIFSRAAKFLPFNSFYFDLNRPSPLRAFDEPGGYARAYELDWNRPKSVDSMELRIWEALDSVNTFITSDESSNRTDALYRFLLVNSLSPHGWEFHTIKSRAMYSREGFGFRKGVFEYPEADFVVEYPELFAVLEFAELLTDIEEMTNEKHGPNDSMTSRILETLKDLVPQNEKDRIRYELKNDDSRKRMLKTLTTYGISNFIYTIVMSKARSFTKYLNFNNEEDREHFLLRSEMMCQSLANYLES